MKIYGDYHTHTKFCHGKNTVMQNALAAREKGLKEIAITGHGYGHFLFGMRRKDFAELREEAQAASEATGVRVLIGVEGNIVNTNSDIDLTPDEIEKFDIVLCGIHRAVRSGGGKRLNFLLNKNNTQRNTDIVVSALKKHKIDVLTHPGRYLNVDLLKVANACKETDTLFELNANCATYSEDELTALAATGAQFIIGSDAHTSARVGDISKLSKNLSRIFAPGQIVNTVEDFLWKH